MTGLLTEERCFGSVTRTAVYGATVFGYSTHAEVIKMLIGYARVSKADGTQTTNLQSDTNRS